MGIPYRGQTGHGTYFISANCDQKRHLLQSHRMSNLFVEVLYHYRTQNKYLVHEFVVMPNHFHLLITPGGEITLERCMQLIKGSVSYRAKREFGILGHIWQTSFFDRRVRDWKEYCDFRLYIHNNPVKSCLCTNPQAWEYSSASGKYELDVVPQRLKPGSTRSEMQA
jgi:putative transposase